MKNFWNTFLACLLAIVAGSVIVMFLTIFMFAGMIAAFSSEETVIVKHNSVLKLELNESIMDNPSNNLRGMLNPLSMSVNRSLSLLSVLNAIEQAAEDPKIEGIYLNMSSLSMGMAKMEEIRDALVRFKESGKFIISYSDYYTQGSYFLASTADSIYVNPEGAIDWQGLATAPMFFKGTLDKLGVKAEIFRVGEFKSAVEPYITDRMSPENRLQLEVLLNSIWGEIVAKVAEARGIEPHILNGYASDLTVTNMQKALELKLVDGLKYMDEVEAQLAELSYGGEDGVPETVTLSDYIKSPKIHSAKRLSRNKVALIYAEGNIVQGGNADGTIDGETLARELAKVRRDSTIKAVVFRVNSPGGSALASEIIWREVTLIREHKPVIISMGDYAASGGYYISCPADVIMAGKFTLTGSIGVFGRMFNIGDAARNKLGVTVDVAKTNPAGDMGNMFRAMTPAERTFIQNSVEDVYDTFVGHVADGRNLSREEVLRVAGGRVWSGVNALQNGLIDGHGGLKDAIALAADRAGISDDFRVVTPEDALDPWSQLLNAFLMAKVSSSLHPAEAELLNEYRNLMHVLEQEGVQARMPYTFRIEM